MGKYDSLRDFLRSQRRARLQLTFKRIEKIIAAPLPDAAMKPRWWIGSDGAAPIRPQVAAWHSAGYDAQLLAGRRVTFTRVR